MKNNLVKRITQFTLGTLLLLVLWFAGTFAGYRRGFDNGYLAGQEKRAAEEPYWQVYNADKFLPDGFDPANPKPDDFNLLMAHVMNLKPETWPPTGGSGKFLIAPYNKSFIVFNTGQTHEAVSESLSKLSQASDPMRALRDAIGMPGADARANPTRPMSP